MRGYTSNTQVDVAELNMTSTIEPYLWFTQNTQREMLYNASKPVTGGATSFQDSLAAIYVMSQLVDDLEW